MIEIPLHVGIEHPNLLWIAVPSLLSFAAGLGLGLFAGTDSPEPETEPVSETDR